MYHHVAAAIVNEIIMAYSNVNVATVNVSNVIAPAGIAGVNVSYGNINNGSSA